jgi:hypothetical protein
MLGLHRRHLLASAANVAAASLFSRAALAQDVTTFSYRGFTVDTTAAQGAPNLADVAKSLKHQIDITADCGTTPKIMDFFKSQTIYVKPGQGDGGGRFSSKVKGCCGRCRCPGAGETGRGARDAACLSLVGAARRLQERRDRAVLRARAGWRLLSGGRLRAQERSGVLRGYREPLSLGQCRPPPRTTARHCTTSNRSIINGWATGSAW